MLDAVPDKSKILSNKCVANIDHSDDKVVVSFADGSSYEGDIIVGADGIHSAVRKEMWRHANRATPGLIGFEEQDRTHCLSSAGCFASDFSASDDGRIQLSLRIFKPNTRP